MIDNKDDEEKHCTHNGGDLKMIWDVAFWQLQKKLSVHSVKSLTFAKVCKFFRLNLKNIILRDTKLMLNA